MGRRALLFSSFLATLFGSQFWTGFPIFLSGTLNNDSPTNLAKVYSYATFGSLVSGLLGGFISDLWGAKSIAVVTSLLNSVVIFMMVLCLKQNSSLVLLLIPVLYFLFAANVSAEWAWLMGLKSNNQESSSRNGVIDRMVVSFFG
jgi:MFS family permease